MSPDNVSIGEQIAKLRSLRGLTQEQLAAGSEVSVDIVRKLEQGTRATARLATLRRIADALGVRMSLVLTPPSLVREISPPELGGIRTVLTRELVELARDESSLTVDGADDPAPSSLDASIDEAWRQWQSGDYTVLAAALPSLITEARHSARENTGDAQLHAYRHVATTSNLAAGVAIMVGNEDLAWLATAQGVSAATSSEDRLTRASTEHFVAWIYRRQGRYDECQRLATQAAEEYEPSLMRGDERQISVWGGLLINASGAAAREEHSKRADELLDIARGAAARLGRDRADQWSVFGPRIVAQTAVGNAVELGDLERAIALSTNVNRTGGTVLPTWEARYQLALAFAQVECAQDTNACRSLLTAHAAAPAWMPHYRLGQDLTRQLAERAGSRRSQELQELIVKMQLNAAA